MIEKFILDAFNCATEKLDVAYSYNIAKQLEEFRSDANLGYRPAGSDAERQAGDYIFSLMSNIGLSPEKHKICVDGWEYKGAYLTYGKNAEYKILLGGYQTELVVNNLKTTLIDVGRGTEEDYKDIDVKGKLVLVHINQRDEWWINYPAYQASKMGALAVIAVQDRGYGEVDPAALNAQDICGDKDAPAFLFQRKTRRICWTRWTMMR